MVSPLFPSQTGIPFWILLWGDGLSGENTSSSQACGTTTGSAVEQGQAKSKRVIVRGTDRRFCGRERHTRMVCCLPGARVLDVSEQVRGILKREGKQTHVPVHTNDISRKREEFL